MQNNYNNNLNNLTSTTAYLIERVTFLFAVIKHVCIVCTSLVGVTHYILYMGIAVEELIYHNYKKRLHNFFVLAFAVGVNLLYLCICIYLYGDLAIYAAAVPKSMRDVAW